MKKTRVIGGIATDTTSGDVNELFHPDVASQFVSCPNAVEDGWVLTGSKWAAPVPYIAPDPVINPTPPSRVLTKLQYMELFTDEELATIYSTAKSVVQIEVWLEKFKLAQEIDLDYPPTIAGLAALEGAGLIGVGRAAEILLGKVA